MYELWTVEPCQKVLPYTAVILARITYCWVLSQPVKQTRAGSLQA